MPLLETYLELPHSIGVTLDTLGRDYHVHLGGLEVTIRLPRINWSGNWATVVPPDFVHAPDDAGSASYLDEVRWGVESNHDKDDMTKGTAWVSTIGITAEAEPGTEQETADKLTDTMEDWWPGACDWVEVLTRQIHGPPGKSLVLGAHHPIWTKFDGEVQRMYRESPVSITLRRYEGPDAPIPLTVELLQAALARAVDGPPPIECLLVRDARLAHDAGTTRRAVIDAGTAVELAITKILEDRLGKVPPEVVEQLLEGHRMLGARTKLLKTLGGTLPDNTQAGLVTPRNAATHKGTDPTGKESHEALLIAAEIVEAAYPLTSFQ